MANVIRIGGGGGGQNLTLPPMVANLAASTGDQSITLTWDNPDSDALAGILIVYNDKHVPTKISDGTKVDAGLVETYELTGLTNETLYYIRVFPYNAKKQYQTMLEGATVTATPDNFPEEPTEYTALTEFISSNSYVIPETGWFRIDAIARSGDGGRTVQKSGNLVSTPGGGGTGGHSRSEIAANKGDIISIKIQNGDITISSETIENLNMSSSHGSDGIVAATAGDDSRGGPGGTANGGNKINETGLTGSAGRNGRIDPGEVYAGGSGAVKNIEINSSKTHRIAGGNGQGIRRASNSNGYNYINYTTGTEAKVFISRGNTNVLSPSAASTLSLTPRNASIEASWTNSEDPESVGTLLVSNPTHEPQDITDGTAVDVAEATSYTLTDLPNDKPTYISLFSYNADKTKYSAAKSDVEIPREVTWADTVEEAQQEAKEATDKAAVAEEQAKQANETLQAKTEELAHATATFNALIASDIQNDTKVISDNMILDNADMLATPWEVGTPNKVGDIVWYMIGDVKQYYKVVQPTENADPNHTPNIVPAVFVAINKTNAGTIDDPIPAVRGMEYEYGKYYLDNEDGKIYICKRGEETGTIVLQYLPHELIGHYFELATLTE